MSRRKPINAEILEASKAFDANIFAETVKGAFSDFPDYRRNQKRVLYPIWYLSLVVLCGFFCGCNTIEEIAEYAQLQEEWFSSLLGKQVSAPSHGSLWWFLVPSDDAIKLSRPELRKYSCIPRMPPGPHFINFITAIVFLCKKSAPTGVEKNSTSSLGACRQFV
jgi:DDE_Tnp_1-associated